MVRTGSMYVGVDRVDNLFITTSKPFINEEGAEKMLQ